MRKSFLYILGRTFYCLGELPRALETYYEAADCADTTASDCDLRQLGLCYVESTSNLRRIYAEATPKLHLRGATHKFRSSGG